MSETTHPTAGPLELGRGTLIHLPAGLAARALHVDASYWEHTGRGPELDDGRILSVFDYDETWAWWERHPDGDELVVLLSGEIELLLDDALGQRAVRLRTGECAIVPAGAWHRAVILAPSQMLFITPTPARTEHRDA